MRCRRLLSMVIIVGFICNIIVIDTSYALRPLAADEGFNGGHLEGALPLLDFQ